MRVSFMKQWILFGLSLIFLLSLSPIASAGDIEETLRNFVKEHYPWEEIQISELSSNNNLLQEEIRHIYIDRRPPGRTVFTIEYRDGRKALVTAYIRAFDWVVMSSRPYGKGHVIEGDDLYRVLMDVTKIPRGAIRETQDAVGKTLKRSIIANSPLVQEMLADGSAVRKGKRVNIIAESPYFVITTSGELKENGYVGSPVKAINLASKKTIKGILIDENTLKVEF